MSKLYQQHPTTVKLTLLVVIVGVVTIIALKTMNKPATTPPTTTPVPVTPSKITMTKITDANNTGGAGYGGSNVSYLSDGSVDKTNVYNPTNDASVNGNTFNRYVLKLVSTLPAKYSVTSLEYSFIYDSAHSPSKVQVYTGDQSSTLSLTSSNYVQQFADKVDYTLGSGGLASGDVQTIHLDLKTPVVADTLTLQIFTASGYQNYPVEVVFNGVPA